ncbi:FAD-binding oxidoreductase [Saccharospirillum sp. HFRX-1]|uniref:FAD-binding oxidoreductase n=1 Tax=unclassified Saccharospirillum TaxID=2633430 RepID=UPI003723D35A
MKRWWLVGSLLLASVSTNADELKPFTTDGCSVFPDGTPRQQSLWLDCCIAHDLAYWMGGTRDERRQADEELRQCVADIGAEEIGEIMLAGVRVGGSPYWPTGYRWGYGWGLWRGYEAVTDEELEQVHQRLNEMRRLLDKLDEQLAVPVAED